MEVRVVDFDLNQSITANVLHRDGVQHDAVSIPRCDPRQTGGAGSEVLLNLSRVVGRVQIIVSREEC